MAEISPERTHRWLGVVMPLLTQAGPVLSLVLLLLGAVQVYWLLGALTRCQGINREFVERLLAEKQQHIDLALKAAPCPPAP